MEIPGAMPIGRVTAAVAVAATAVGDGQPPFIFPGSRIGLRDSRRRMTMTPALGDVP
jgi:hypothetical protein